MRFALLGEHPDGLAITRALVASGRHQLAAYSGPRERETLLRQWQYTFVSIRDLEEVLADPVIEAVVIASKLSERPAHLRRVLQSNAMCSAFILPIRRRTSPTKRP